MSFWKRRSSRESTTPKAGHSSRQVSGRGARPRASIVILNYNGKHHLKGCFESLRAMDYPEDCFEVILVDNGSTDGSLEELRDEHAWVRVLENDKNLGFSRGCNQGAKDAARPEFQAQVLVFLNNDMRVEPAFLSELVAPIERGELQATTGKMFSWDGKRIDSAGGGMNFHGIGIQKGYKDEPAAWHDEPAPTLFACGGAMAIDARVFAESGGFDEEFFAYYEDVDLGWRLWVQGARIGYVPTAVCYHHHSSTSRRFPMETIRLLQVRNPILACFKNYDEAHLKRVLPAQLALAMRRTFAASGLEDGPFRIEEADVGSQGVVGRLFDRARHSIESTVPISRVAAADLIGINDLLGNFDHWRQRRKEVQARRQRSDEEIFRLFHKPLWCIEEEPGYRELQGGLVSWFGLDDLFEGLEADGRDPSK